MRPERMGRGPWQNESRGTHMDHLAEHNAQPGSPQEFPPSLGGGKTAVSAAPARGVPKPLFIAVAVLAAALAAICAWLAVCSRDQDRAMASMRSSKEFMRQELDQASAGLAAVQEELAQARKDLARARDAIGLLEEYSLAAPNGTVPEYTALYPDFYAPAWEGETVSGGKVCCLTFDDGPSPNTDRVLEILDRYGVKATFFVVGAGKSGQADQERMRNIAAAGHTIAMHSWTHDYKKVYASVEAFLDEFSTLYQYIYEVTGVRPQLYRFPGGSINGYDRGVYQEIIAEMTRRGFAYYDWNASAQDATVRPRPSADIAADCLRGVGRELVVVLAHDSAARGTTVDALPAVIEGYQNAGYTFSALHPGVEQVTFGYPKIR